MAARILAKIDKAGRIVLPKDLRDAFGYTGGTPIGFCIHNQCIILQEVRKKCSFCESQSNLHKIHGKYVCGKCISDTFKEYDSEFESERIYSDSI